MNLNGLQLGLVVLWGNRPEIGKYGFLAPARYSGRELLFVFDENGLTKDTPPITEGAYVFFKKKPDGKRIKAVDVAFAAPPPIDRIPRKDRRFTFSRLDIKHLPGFVELIKAPKDDVSRLISNRLSSTTRVALTKYQGEKTLRCPMRGLLIADLNKVISGPCIFEKNRFKQIRLRRQTAIILNSKPTGTELRRLNRLLLEDAFPQVLHLNPPSTDYREVRNVGYVSKVDLDARFGFVRLPESNAYFHFDLIPSEGLVPKLGDVVQCRILETRKGLIAYDIWPSTVRIKEADGLSGQGKRQVLEHAAKLAKIRALQNELRQSEEPGVPNSPSLTGETIDSESLPETLWKGGVSETYVKKQEKESAPPSVKGKLTKVESATLCVGPFRYDRSSSLLILPSGRTLKVPRRYSLVLDAMLKKDALGHSMRTSSLEYLKVAGLFETGRLEEQHPDWNRTDLRAKMKDRLNFVEEQQKTIAQEFRRQFSKWLKTNKIDPKAIIRCDKKAQCYQIAHGWAQKRMVVGESDVRSISVGRHIELAGSSGEHAFGVSEETDPHDDEQDMSMS